MKGRRGRRLQSRLGRGKRHGLQNCRYSPAAVNFAALCFRCSHLDGWIGFSEVLRKLYPEWVSCSSIRPRLLAEYLIECGDILPIAYISVLPYRCQFLCLIFLVNSNCCICYLLSSEGIQTPSPDLLGFATFDRYLRDGVSMQNLRVCMPSFCGLPEDMPAKVIAEKLRNLCSWNVHVCERCHG